MMNTFVGCMMVAVAAAVEPSIPGFVLQEGWKADLTRVTGDEVVSFSVAGNLQNPFGYGSL
jgi:hypothetical protein